jgi:hypothetical protein
MLTTPSYVTAMLLYWVAAIIGLVLMRRLWFTMPLRPAGGAALGLIGGLLLAPAFPGPEIQSMAPALIIVLFNTLFGEGAASAAAPALWLLVGAVVGVVTGVTWARRRARRASY